METLLPDSLKLYGPGVLIIVGLIWQTSKREERMSRDLAVQHTSLVKMAAYTNPANGYSRSVSFKYNGTNWVEFSRTTADIPN